MVIFGAKDTFVLLRKSDDNDAIWRASAIAGAPDLFNAPTVAADKVLLTKLSLWMPVMPPSISEEQKLLSFMDTGVKSLLSWRTTTTDVIQGDHAGIFTWYISSQQGITALRHIFVALQACARLNNQERNPMVFDRLDVSEISL